MTISFSPATSSGSCLYTSSSGLSATIAGILSKVPKFIQERVVSWFREADKDYGDGIAKKLGLG